MKHNNPSHEEFTVASLSCTRNEFGSALVCNEPIIVHIDKHGTFVDHNHFKTETGLENRLLIKIKDMDFENKKFAGEFKIEGVKKTITGKVSFDDRKIYFYVAGDHKESVLNGLVTQHS